MKEFSYIIRDENGIHARPAGLLVRRVKESGASVTLEKGGRAADASRLFAVMGLGIRCGDTVTVRVEGDGEAEAASALEAFFKENL